jgi:hypothetical protein
VENAQLKGENGRLKEENHWLRRQLGESQDGATNPTMEVPDSAQHADANGVKASSAATTAVGGSLSKKRKSSIDESVSEDDNTSSSTSTIHHALQHVFHGSRAAAVLPSVMMPSPSRAPSLASILQAAEHADAYPQQEQRQQGEAAATEMVN